MTDKQIIIDGVDVSGCKNLMQGIVPFGCMEDRKTCSCMNNSNCLYKQLKVKEHECERLKKKLNPKLKNAHCAYFEGQTGLCKAKEFTKCNPVGCKLYTIDELSTIVDLQQQLKVKEQECDELKKKNYELTEEVSIDRALFAEIDQLKAELEEYKNVVNKLAGMQVILTNENGVPQLYDNAKNLRLKKLSQTLTEIKEYLKPYLCRRGVEPQWIEWQMAQKEKQEMAKDILKILQKYKVVLK